MLTISLQLVNNNILKKHNKFDYNGTCHGGGIYYITSEQSVHEHDLLETGKIGKHEGLRKFDMGSIVIARQQCHLQNCRSGGLFLVCSG